MIPFHQQLFNARALARRNAPVSQYIGTSPEGETVQLIGLRERVICMGRFPDGSIRRVLDLTGWDGKSGGSVSREDPRYDKELLAAVVELMARRSLGK